MSRRRAEFKPKVCDGCGEPFVPNSGRQRWCSPGGCQVEMESAAVAVTEVEPEPQEGARAAPDPELLAAVREAVERNASELEWYGEDRDGSGYRSVAFGFVRELRAHPRLEDLEPASAADVIEPYLAALVESNAVPVLDEYAASPWAATLGDCDCFGNPADPVEDFLKLWGSLRPVPGLAGAVRDARRAEARGRPDHFGAEWASPRYEPRRVFLRVCVALSVWSREAGEPEGTFPLALEPLARELGWPRRTVGDWRTWAVEYGFLDPVAGYAIGYKAATFRLGAAFGGGPTW